MRLPVCTPPGRAACPIPTPQTWTPGPTCSQHFRRCPLWPACKRPACGFQPLAPCLGVCVPLVSALPHLCPREEVGCLEGEACRAYLWHYLPASLLPHCLGLQTVVNLSALKGSLRTHPSNCSSFGQLPGVGLWGGLALVSWASHTEAAGLPTCVVLSCHLHWPWSLWLTWVKARGSLPISLVSKAHFSQRVAVVRGITGLGITGQLCVSLKRFIVHFEHTRVRGQGRSSLEPSRWCSTLGPAWPRGP